MILMMTSSMRKTRYKGKLRKLREKAGGQPAFVLYAFLCGSAALQVCCSVSFQAGISDLPDDI